MPNRFLPLPTSGDFQSSLSAINNNFAQLDNESVTKAFKGPKGNSIVEGRLPYKGGYGTLIYDSDGKARIILGIQPDGSAGMTIAKEGYDVIDDLSW